MIRSSSLLAFVIGLFVLVVCSSRDIANADEADAGAPAVVGGGVDGSGACPSDMVEINLDYCQDVEEICLYDVDSYGKRLPGAHETFGSCGEYQYPTRCLSATKVHMHYCIDRFEFPNQKGAVPRDWMSWYDAKNEAAKLGKRLCTDREWTLAAEGSEMRPLPYGDGYHRDNTLCNIDRHEKVDVFKATTPHSPVSEVLRSLLVPSGSMPCISSTGVHDMSGNIDEFVLNESGKPYVSALKGGHIWHVRQASRPTTFAHGPTFAWYETGFRACKDITRP